MDDCKCGKGCMSKNSIADAASSVAPAVVNIFISEGNMASGTIIGPDGWILTCAHVVAEYIDGKPCSKGIVTVKLQDGRNFDGYVVIADCQYDVAIVKIISKTPLPSARLGNSEQLRPGDWVVAVGCPMNLQNTITAGIVSCVNRKGSDLVGIGAGREFIQTDCAINEGSSGGPLVNLDGEIVGMNVLKIMEADGLSFAVPIDVVVKVIEHFWEKGRVVRQWLGLLTLDLNPAVISQLEERGVKFHNVISGILVLEVTPGSPADRAGLRDSDVIIFFDEKPVKSINEIVDIMGDMIGVPLEVVIVRQDSKHVLSVVPGEAKYR